MAGKYVKILLVGLTSLMLMVGCQQRALGPVAQGDFEAQGKLALRTPDDSLSVRFRWRQTGSRYDLQLWGPFGQGRTRLVGDSTRMQVLDGDGSILLDGAPDKVMRSQIGWDIPLVALISWAQGMPAPDLPLVQSSVDDQGRYLAFSQEKWQINYQKYQDEGDRPLRVALTRGDYRIKVAFNRWQTAE